MLRRPSPKRNKRLLRAGCKREDDGRERVRLRLRYASDSKGCLLLIVGTSTVPAVAAAVGASLCNGVIARSLDRPRTHAEHHSSPAARSHATLAPVTGGRNIAPIPAAAARTTAPHSEALTPASWYKTPDSSVPRSRPHAFAM